jgi:hypothetical protein
LFAFQEVLKLNVDTNLWVFTKCRI